eukprot:scaffold1671_cov344-Pavlova_lutheri.AAC.5
MRNLPMRRGDAVVEPTMCEWIRLHDVAVKVAEGQPEGMEKVGTMVGSQCHRFPNQDGMGLDYNTLAWACLGILMRPLSRRGPRVEGRGVVDEAHADESKALPNKGWERMEQIHVGGT